MVHALAAGAAGAQALVSQAGAEQMAATSTVSPPEERARTKEAVPSLLHHQPKRPDVARSERSGTSPHTSSPTRRRISSPMDPRIPPVPASSTSDTHSDFDGATNSDRRDASEHASSERHPQRQQEEPDVQENTRGKRRGPVPADGHETLPLSPREGKVGEEKERRTSAPTSRGGSGKGGSIDADGGDDHERSLLDETGAGEDEDKDKESTGANRPTVRDSSSTRAMEESSPSRSLEDVMVGEEGGEDGGVGLLDEEPDKCHVE